MNSTSYSTFKKNHINPSGDKDEKTKGYLVKSIDCIITSIEEINKKISEQMSPHHNCKKNESLINQVPIDLEKNISNQFTTNFNVTKSKKDLKEHLLNEINNNSRQRVNSYFALLNQLKESPVLNTVNPRRHRQFLTHSGTFGDSNTFCVTIPKVRVITMINTDRVEKDETKESSSTANRRIVDVIKINNPKAKAKSKPAMQSRVKPQPQMEPQPKLHQKAQMEKYEQKHQTETNNSLKATINPLEVIKTKAVKHQLKQSKPKKRSTPIEKVTEKECHQFDQQQKEHLTNRTNPEKIETNSILEIPLKPVNVGTSRNQFENLASLDIIESNNNDQSNSNNNEANNKATNDTINRFALSRNFNAETIKQVKEKNQNSKTLTKHISKQSFHSVQNSNNKDFYYDAPKNNNLGCKCEIGLCSIF